MREIKFRGMRKGRWIYGSYATDYKNYHAIVVPLNHEMMENCHVDPKSIGQYTGLKDKSGVDIYEGDLVNIFYTSKTDDWFFDGVYRVSIDPTGVNLNFVRLLWELGGYNQTPYESAKVSSYGFVRNDYKNTNGDFRLCVSETNKWDYSNYFKVIGNIYENPELLNE